MTRRPWTPAEKQLVREQYGTTPTAALAAALGRTPKAVALMAFALRRTRPNHRWTPRADAALRRLNAAGLPDGIIAGRLGCDRTTVAARRRLLGLPSNQHGPHHRGSTRRKAAEQLKRAGLRSMGELRVKAWGDRAEKLGLPRELNPTAVKIVLALAAGPKSRRELVAALGQTWKTANGGRNNLTCGRAEGSYPAWLAALGLVECVSRYSGRGGRLPSVYRLTPAAVVRLRGAGVVVRGTCATPGCSRPVASRGQCRPCYSLARYHAKKHDPAWKANFYARINEFKRRQAETRALADLARIAAQLESKL